MSRTRKANKPYLIAFCPHCNLADPPMGHVCEKWPYGPKGFPYLSKLDTYHWYPTQTLDLLDELVVSILDLKTATRNVLARADIVSIADLLVRTPSDMRRVSGIGEFRLHEIESNLAYWGIHLVWEKSRCSHRNCRPCLEVFGPFPTRNHLLPSSA